MKAFDDRTHKKSEPVSHHLMNKFLARFAGAEIDKIVKIKEHAIHQAHHLSKENYGQRSYNDLFDGNNQYGGGDDPSKRQDSYNEGERHPRHHSRD